MKEIVFRALDAALDNGYDETADDPDAVVTDLLDYEADLEGAIRADVRRWVVEWQQRKTGIFRVHHELLPETRNIEARIEIAFPAVPGSVPQRVGVIVFDPEHWQKFTERLQSVPGIVFIEGGRVH
jgi:hypothetical protein